MHWTGKVFLGLVIVLAPLDAYFALVLIAHRDKWNTAYEEALNQYESQHPQLLTTRRKVRDRQYRLDRLENDWPRIAKPSSEFPNEFDYLGNVGGGVLNAGQAGLVLGAGSAAGIPTQSADGTNPIVYVFQDNGENGSLFLGEFELVQVDGDQSGARLTRPPFGNEVMNWPTERSGAQFRIRPGIPSAWRSLFDNLFVQYAEEERSLDFQQRQLQRMDGELVNSQSILDQRIAELSGDPDPPEGADQDVINGLVETIRREEVDRNDDLDDLYNLRREYLRKTNRLNDLIAANQEAVAQLPGAQPTAGSSPAPATVPVTVPADMGE